MSFAFLELKTTGIISDSERCAELSLGDSEASVRASVEAALGTVAEVFVSLRLGNEATVPCTRRRKANNSKAQCFIRALDVEPDVPRLGLQAQAASVSRLLLLLLVSFKQGHSE